MNCHANKCIECTVQQCAYHCENENYCSLDRIMVGTHEANPTVDQCTDCKSFQRKCPRRISPPNFPIRRIQIYFKLPLIKFKRESILFIRNKSDQSLWSLHSTAPPRAIPK